MIQCESIFEGNAKQIIDGCPVQYIDQKKPIKSSLFSAPERVAYIQHKLVLHTNIIFNPLHYTRYVN